MRKSESFFSIYFKYSKQTTAERWPVKEAGGCHMTGDGSKPLKKSAGYSKTGRDMV